MTICVYRVAEIQQRFFRTPFWVIGHLMKSRLNDMPWRGLRHIFVFTFAAAGFLASPLACAQTAAPLPANVVKLLQESNIPIEAVGVAAMRVADGVIVLSHNPDKSLAPASTLKVLTSIVGLEKLGPAYRARTELRSEAKVTQGVLNGDLVLRGFGSPDFDWQALQKMVTALHHKGINEIRGNLVIDRQWFQPARTDVGVPPFDESPEAQYNMIPDALSLNTNLVNADITSDATTVRVNFSPKLDRVSIVSFLTLVDRDCAKWEDGWKTPVYSLDEDGSIRIELVGEFPKNCSRSEGLNVLDRTQFADRMFRALWQNAGGVFRGSTIEKSDAPAPAAATNGTLLAAHESRTLAELVRDINKNSDNPMTRLLFLTLGATAKNNVGAQTSAKADAEIRAWLKSYNINDAELVLENGSGLSRAERIRPSQLVQILSVASRSKWAPEFMASLPIAAVDGGMRNRLRTSRAAEVARLKTGSLKNVAAIAGYVPDASNQLVAISVMINHDNAKGPVARPILDAIVDWVANSGGVTAIGTASKKQ
jgi:serine-type D-Ala-D-Ala carboxypeptidase/endopeptidase (penicillin-binding protein 4)